MTEKIASNTAPHAGRCGTAAKPPFDSGNRTCSREGLATTPPLPASPLFSSSLQFNSVAAAIQACVELFLHPHLFTIDTEAKQKTRGAHGQSNTKERSGNGRRRRFVHACRDGPVSDVHPAPQHSAHRRRFRRPIRVAAP
jgi:hypothetical protein